MLMACRTSRPTTSSTRWRAPSLPTPSRCALRHIVRPCDHAAQAFFNDFLAGKLTPFLKSEEIPADNGGMCCAVLSLFVSHRDAEAVKTVVGKNFKDIVLDASKVCKLGGVVRRVCDGSCSTCCWRCTRRGAATASSLPPSGTSSVTCMPPPPTWSVPLCPILLLCSS